MLLLFGFEGPCNCRGGRVRRTGRVLLPAACNDQTSVAMASKPVALSRSLVRWTDKYISSLREIHFEFETNTFRKAPTKLLLPWYRTLPQPLSGQIDEANVLGLIHIDTMILRESITKKKSQSYGHNCHSKSQCMETISATLDANFLGLVHIVSLQGYWGSRPQVRQRKTLI